MTIDPNARTCVTAATVAQPPVPQNQPAGCASRFVLRQLIEFGIQQVRANVDMPNSIVDQVRDGWGSVIKRIKRTGCATTNLFIVLSWPHEDVTLPAIVVGTRSEPGTRATRSSATSRADGLQEVRRRGDGNACISSRNT